MKNILVAYDKNYGIGAANDLLWQRDLPADLRRFKDLTSGNVVIMGRKTYESIGRPLPNRQNIVITHKPLELDGVVVVHSLDEAYTAAEKDKEIFVIGGGQIYLLALETVDCVYATEVDATFLQADVFFPRLNAEVWQETMREHHAKDDRNKYDFDFVKYRRR